MKSTSLRTVVRRVAVTVPLYLMATLASAQTPQAPDPASMSLQDLLEIEVVSTASKFPQEVKEAPASITVISADEIRRYGHRTLADVLRSVRGFYTTNDRNYSYVGMRGFLRPGDYNTRVLLLVDGQRLNDPIYDMAPIGTDFPIDASLIDRVEVIRGPGSSLYGTNAFLAVINVITRTGSQEQGVRAQTFGGMLGTQGAAASFGRLFSGGREVLLSASTQRIGGAGRLYYPEFNTGEPLSGVATGLDHDRSSNVFGSAAVGRFQIRGGVGVRNKQVPTAAFDTVFGDDRFRMIDNRAYLNATYDGPIGRGWSVTGRAAYDYYGYRGDMPYDYGEPEPVMWLDLAQSHTASGEITVRRRIAGAHQLTAGAELRHQFRNHMSAEDNTGLVIDVNRPGTILGVYVQDEWRVRPWLLLSGGARLDQFPTFGSRATPRMGAVLLPRAQTAIKILYGQAYRAPNPYERYYYPEMDGRTLAPEGVRNTEVVWEEYLSGRVRTAVTAFRYQADNIIELAAVATPLGEELYFKNGAAVNGVGLEAEIEVKFASGVSSRVSHAYVRAVDATTAAPVPNAPRNMSKVGLQFPLSSIVIGIEGQYLGERLTLGGAPLAGFFVPNVTLTSRAAHRIEFTVGVYNIFGHEYSDPGGEEHVQASIPQDGRTAVATVRVRF